MADRLRVHQKASDRHNYSPKVDRPSMPSPALRRPSLLGDLPTSSPSIQRLMVRELSAAATSGGGFLLLFFFFRKTFAEPFVHLLELGLQADAMFRECAQERDAGAAAPAAGGRGELGGTTPRRAASSAAV